MAIRDTIRSMAAYVVPGAPAVKADRPPRNPYLGYSTSMGNFAYELYPNSPAGWIAAAQYNVWARNCINARMSFVSKANLKLWKAGDNGKPEEVTDHPILPLLREVNPINANRKSFKRGIEQQLCVFGRCVVLKVTGYRDLPAELYILPRQMVEVLSDPELWIRGYRWLPTGQIYQPSEIIDLFYPAHDGTPAESSPTASAVGAITRYSLSDLAQAAIDKRGGQGGGIVFYPDNLDPKEFDAMRASWENIRSNPNNAGRDIHVSSALKYESGALTARDMQREERAQRLMKEIMAAYQVPPAIAGDYSDASVLANADAQQSAFAEQWGIEELEFIEEALNNQLLWANWPETRDQGLYLAHDLAEIPALREDEQEKESIIQMKVQTATIAMAGTLISLNEARQMIGQPEINDPRADAVPMVNPVTPPPPPMPEMPEDTMPDMEDEETVLMTMPAKAVKADAQTGVMVALMLRPEDAQQIEAQVPATWADEGVAPELPADYHITLVYLGESSAYDAMSKMKIMNAAETIARKFTVPVQATIKGAGRFVNPSADAIWAGVAADGLLTMQQQIINELRGAGITVSNEHGDYRPHMTLGYVASGQPASVPPVQPVRATFSGLTVMWAGNRFDYPFGGDAYLSVTAKARRIIADYVGVKVKTPADVGVIEKVLRFGEYEGKTATKAAPLFMVNGLAYTADELEVID